MKKQETNFKQNVQNTIFRRSAYKQRAVCVSSDGPNTDRTIIHESLLALIRDFQELRQHIDRHADLSGKIIKLDSNCGFCRKHFGDKL